MLIDLIFAVSSISKRKKIENDKLYILIGEEAFLINLIENSINQEIISILPMKIKLQNENISSKNNYLSIRIDTRNLISSTSSRIQEKKEI